MTLDTLFSMASTLVLPAWLLLIVAPKWKWTSALTSSFVMPLALGSVYAFLIATEWGSAEGGFGSLQEVQKLFANPGLLVAGWIHYLVFDLFVGAWEVRDSQRLGIPHALVIPCLLLTFVFGPIGLLVYLALRFGLRRRLALNEAIPQPAA